MRPSRRRAVRRCRCPSGAIAALLCAAVGLLAPGVGSADVAADSPPAAEAADAAAEKALLERGQRIYRDGESAAGDIVALMGDDRIEVPASALPCASCHGLDGRGRPEGGVHPSNLTWPSLSRPYRADSPSGRQHPPYDRSLLKRAITLGVDPAGNPLHVAMPRYQMSHGDLEALVTYLMALGEARDPGVLEDRLRLGVLLPPAGPMAAMARSLRRVLEVSRDRVNAGGGLYGRRLELVFLELPADPRQHVAAVDRFLTEEEIFALAPSFVAGDDTALLDLVADHEVPLVAPFTLDARQDFPLNRQVFFLWPGLEDVARVLVRMAAGAEEEGAGAASSLVVLSAPDPRLRRAAESAVAEARRRGELSPSMVAWPLAGELPAADHLLLLVPGSELPELWRRLAAAGRAPQLYLPGSLAGRSLLEAPPELAARLRLAYPTLPGDLSEPAAAHLAGLATEAGLPSPRDPVVLAAHLGFELLLQGLEGAGREVSRERLITALEGIFGWSSGYGQPITFGPNRRIGVRGAYGVAFDPASGGLLPAGGWFDLE